MNEPHMAPWWFPANDHPRDKALMDISITVPKGTAGDRQRHAGSAARCTAGMATTCAGAPTSRWRRTSRSSRPATSPSTTGVSHGLPWYVAVSKQLSPARSGPSMRLMQQTPRIVALARRRSSATTRSRPPAAWSTGLDPGFALENQTRPTYPAVGGRRHVARRARARAPVVRRLGVGRRTGATSGSTRARRPSWRCATTRRTAGRRPHGVAARRYASTRADDDVLGPPDRPTPGERPHLRRRGLLPRRR